MDVEDEALLRELIAQLHDLGQRVHRALLRCTDDGDDSDDRAPFRQARVEPVPEVLQILSGIAVHGYVHQATSPEPE